MWEACLILCVLSTLCSFIDVMGLFWSCLFSHTARFKHIHYPESVTFHVNTWSFNPCHHMNVVFFSIDPVCANAVLLCVCLCVYLRVYCVSVCVDRWGCQRWNWSWTKQISECWCYKNSSNCCSESSQSCTSERVQISQVQEESQGGR